MESPSVILVKPEGSGNIGSVCRAMKTMGLSRLIIIPNENKVYEEKAIQTMALHAWDLYEQRQEFNTLAEAVSEYSLTVAFTRRGRQNTLENCIPLPQLTEYLPTQSTPKSFSKIALLFGRESCGLTKDEIAFASLHCYIPSSPEYPSLNLAMAVQVVGYELQRSLLTESKTHQESTFIPPATIQEIEVSLEEPMEALQRLNFFRQEERAERKSFFKNILIKSGSTPQEVTYFTKFLTKIANIRLYR